MAAVGAFDSFSGLHRAQFFAADKDGKTFTEKLINYGNKMQNQGEQVQFSIFDDMPVGEADPSPLLCLSGRYRPGGRCGAGNISQGLETL